jgi:hypothetical protein
MVLDYFINTIWPFIINWLAMPTISVAAVWAFIKFRIEHRFENKLAKELEDHKASLEDRKFQALHELDILLAKKNRWHEKEYEVLFGTWSRLIEANDELKKFVSVMKTHPDLSKKTESELKTFSTTNAFSEQEAKHLIESSDPNKAFSQIIDFRNMKEAYEAFSNFYKYYRAHQIFITPEIKEKFEAADNLIWEIYVDREISLAENDMKIWREANRSLKQKLPPLIKAIENETQALLFPKATA